MPRGPGVRASIGIVGGSRVVGEALALLLQGLGYRARYAAAPAEGAWPLADSEVVLLAPGLGTAQRSALLAAVRGATAAPAIPILELTRGDGAAAGEHCVRWPCRAEELARAIDAVLEPRAIGATGE
ncbi:MAG TPA: hypothetical protein VFE37_27435 [Chloroflexota bacterium]|nr:hypothetical protein [Chloroflexota bacterium]